MSANPFESFDTYIEQWIQSGNITSEQGEVIALVVAILLLAVAAVVLALGLIIYLMQAFAIMRIAKKLEIEKVWLAFIPIAQDYMLGAIAERCDERRGLTVFSWGRIMLIASIVKFAASLIDHLVSELLPDVSMVCLVIMLLMNLVCVLTAVVFLVLRAFCVWKLFREFYAHIVNVVVFVISLFVGPAIPMLVASFLKPLPAKWNVFVAVEE